jgi:hypothetical protein
MQPHNQAISSQGQEAKVEPRPPSVKSMTERQALLAKLIALEVANGARVECQTGAMAVLARGRPVNHVLHFLAGFFTLGIWWFTVWPAAAIFGGEKRMIVQIDEYGNILTQKARRVT